MLATAVTGLMLVPLTGHHAPALHRLVQENRHHLTAHGDYADLVATPLDALIAELTPSGRANLRFGIVLQQSLIGRIDLVPVDPPRYGLGYWLAQSATGKGYATAAVQAVLALARDGLKASDIFAGVTHGNPRSAAVLSRAGFVPLERFETYTRFHRTLGG